MAVYVENEKTFIPLNNAPSTHILKLNFDLYDDVIFNEAFCLNLAKTVGLPTAEASLKKVEDIDYLLIKRYDRFPVDKENKSPEVKRAHQEDFCQALGVPPANKYQCDDGPSLKQCFNLIRLESSAPVIDLERMLDAVIFNFLIGNCDAHAKNFSILYGDRTQLAPLYDLICTLYYKNLSRKMAMKLGGEYRIDNMIIRNFDNLADEISFSKPEVRKRAFELTDTVLSVLPKIELQHPSQEKIRALVKNRCEDFIALV